uniref:Uncharacterized protein n=1 Tax=Acrobeloides nanus TaxID=290746 RepID=A0A914E6Z3_9BILA
MKSEVHVQPLSASKARVFRENPEHVLSAKVKQHLKTYHIPKTKSGTPSYYRKSDWRDRAEINPDRGQQLKSADRLYVKSKQSEAFFKSRVSTPRARVPTETVPATAIKTLKKEAAKAKPKKRQ